MKNFLFVSILCTLFACTQTTTEIKSQATEKAESKLINTEVAPSVIQPISTSKSKEAKPVIPTAPTTNKYPWLSNYQQETALKYNIPTPTNFKRLPIAKGSFADWLQHLSLKAADAKVYTYNGGLKSNQNVHERVLNIDTGKKDLQQCADAVMRLKAEYHFSKAEFDAIHFNFTSGDRVSFEDWSKGRKPVIAGNKVTFTNAGSNINNTYSNFKKYLIQIFNYAGTASLSKEMKSVSIEEMQIGDVFIKGGFPGHAVMVIDMAENDQGEKVFLLSQSYMPAQDIHILKNYNEPNLSPWYSLNFGSDLDTPEWPFTKDDLKRFRN